METLYVLIKLFLGVVRHKLGLTFLGVTRPTEHLIVAEIEMTGLNSDVSTNPCLTVHFRKPNSIPYSTGTPGETSQPERVSFAMLIKSSKLMCIAVSC